MHPAYSVILFTTASGAGYGLLIWLAAEALGGTAPLPTFWSTVLAFALAFGLIIAGLLSSTAHLGRPERAWRAFSQWRTSWLSREGVLAVATFLPAGLLALLAGLQSLQILSTSYKPSSTLAVVAIVAIAFALATVWCTGMIYQSLPTIRAWNKPVVSPIYVALALASGGVLFNLLHAVSYGFTSGTLAMKAIVLLAVAAFLKLEYWRGIDMADKRWTPESATGLGRFGNVRVLEQPHTQANYVMREMGFHVARKHAYRLRRLALLTSFLLPAGLIAMATVSGPMLAVFLCVAAVACMAFGLLTERWLFFAEAQHVVSVFYGAEAA